jgi:hypothetical protein
LELLARKIRLQRNLSLLTYWEEEMFHRELESIEELENLELATTVQGEMDLPEDHPHFVL